MVVGFNHNFRYQGEVYHIQTEDGGVKSPNIVTLLYKGGTILASKKTSYADIARVDNLDQVVEELMKEQHKNMLRALKSGEYDEVIKRFAAGQGEIVEETSDVKASPAMSEPVEEPAPEEKPLPDKKPQSVPAASELKKAVPKPPPQSPSAAVETSLDEVILSYLMGDD